MPHDRAAAADDLSPPLATWNAPSPQPGPPWIGTAGWSIAARYRPLFPANGSGLTRYAGLVNAAEINSSFYRPHRREIYARWAAAVPDGFRFAVKLPKAITHEHRLKACEVLLERFLDETGRLGAKRGALLVQLPPRLVFERTIADGFFSALRARTNAAVACEPRHASWFDPEAEALLRAWQVARVAADPARVPGAETPGGWAGLLYIRLHGSPRVYVSDYDPGALGRVAALLAGAGDTPAWCIFDNTGAGHALGNALQLANLLTG